MKKLLLTLAVALMAIGASAKGDLCAYITDSVANVRNAPNGKVVTTLSYSGNVVTLLKASNGWWKIDSTVEQYGDEEKEITLEGSSTGYWVHNSVIGFTGVGDGTAIIYNRPSRKARKVCECVQLMHPIAVKGNWVKVKTDDGRYTGWIRRDAICYNPLTTCP